METRSYTVTCLQRRSNKCILQTIRKQSQPADDSYKEGEAKNGEARNVHLHQCKFFL